MIEKEKLRSGTQVIYVPEFVFDEIPGAYEVYNILEVQEKYIVVENCTTQEVVNLDIKEKHFFHTEEDYFVYLENSVDNFLGGAYYE